MNFFSRLQTETASSRQYLLQAPLIQRCFARQITLADYLGFLREAYHHVKHTVPLLMSVGAHLPTRYRHWLNDVAEYIEEEIGHEEWILNDIRHAGGDAESVRLGQPSAETELMVAYAYDMIARVNPLGFFGMVHVLEGTSIALADQAADAIAGQLQLPAKAFSYLSSHGALDQEHVKFFEQLMNRVTDLDDQEAILHAAHRFYRLYGDMFRELRPMHPASQPLEVA